MTQDNTRGWIVFAMMGALALGACNEEIDDLDSAALEDEDDAATAPVAAGGDDLTTQQHAGAFPGFGLDISVDGDDVVLDWSAAGPSPSPQASILVLRSTIASDLEDIDNLGPSVEEFLLPAEATSYLDADAALRSQMTPTYYYRVVVDDMASSEKSTMVLKVTTPAFAGYTKFGLCMLGGPQNASDIVEQFGSAVDGVYAWSSETQSWLQWMAADGTGPNGDFALPFGGVVAVGFNSTVDPFLSLAGVVPTNEAFEVDNTQGRVLQTLPALYDGASESSYWVEHAGYWGVGQWDPQGWTNNWYWGPGDQEIQMEACKPYYFELPPDACGNDNECSEGQFCSFVDEAACGSVAAGMCKAKPIGCDPDAPEEPVCGCDGVTYENACKAAYHGTSVEHDGECVSECTMLTFDDAGATDGYAMTGDWGLYTETPPSYTFDAVNFGQHGNVLGTDGNRVDGTQLGYEDEDSEVRTTAITFGQTLEFESWHVDEGGGYYDRKTVEISIDGGQNWLQLSNCHDDPSSQPYCEFLYIQRAGDDWDHITLDIPELYQGQTGLLRFTYDTLDACCSFEQGWFIDNIQTGMGC